MGNDMLSAYVETKGRPCSTSSKVTLGSTSNLDGGTQLHLVKTQKWMEQHQLDLYNFKQNKHLQLHAAHAQFQV